MKAALVGSLALLCFWLLPNDCRSQNVTFKIYQIKNDRLFAKVRDAESLEVLKPEERESSVVELTSPEKVDNTLKVDRKKYSAEVDSRFFLVAYIGDRQVTLEESGFDGVVIKKHNLIFNDFISLKKSLVFSFKELKNKPDKNEKVVIDVMVAGRVHTSFAAIFNNAWEVYGKWGGWVPTNTYSFLGKPNPEGISIGVYPVSLALGGKVRISEGNKYLGISFSANPGYTTSAENNGILLNSISLGPLIDVMGYFYLGYHKGIDLTAKETQTIEDQIIIGFSLDLVSILATGSKTSK